MGRKANLKKLRRMGSHLPVMTIAGPEKQVNVIATGSAAIALGVDKTKDGSPLEPNGYYSFNSKSTNLVNHSKQIKNAYDKSGPAGAALYIAQVEKIAENQIIERMARVNNPELQEVETETKNAQDTF
jgi:hypothetical protein